MTGRAATGRGRRQRRPAGSYGVGDAVRMEWIKLRSLRSTLWALMLVVVGMVGIGVATMANTRPPSTDAARSLFDPTNNVLAGVALGQLVIGVLGVLAVSAEYSSGTIRSTFAAIPRRPMVLAAKAAVFAVVLLITGEAVCFATFFAGRAALADDVPAPALEEPGVLRAVVLTGAYLAQIGLIGIGLGAIARHTAGAIGALVAVTFVLPLIAVGLTGTTVAKFFPTLIVANSIAVAKPVSDTLAPWTGFCVLCLYTLAALGVGGWLLNRRDA
ncbi:MAG TPA: ABC transporter permease subunit [Actinomycetales bacterium]|nr:ABC transporter permease subunit [Actinomycetales bacterium]